MFRKTFLVLVIMMSMSSCATTGKDPEPSPVVVDSSCNWVKPIYLTDSDILTLDPRTKRDILAHNETWKRICDENH